MFRIVIVCAWLFSSGYLHAQKEASVWYFGLGAGLDFNSGSPIVRLDGKMNTMEGVATLSDTKGNLLFYTNGENVWNRQHVEMPNGKGLYGHFSTSQSAIAVPKINDPHRYYLFTVDATGGPNGFNYSIINMTLDGGKGDVEVKNIPIERYVCEKLTAVKHCNGTDIWVLVHRFNSADILAYLITEAGVNPVPVVSSAGIFVSSIASNHSVGCMKASPDGSKLAVAHFNFGAEVMDFNNRTGVVSGGGALFLPPLSYGNPKGAYGVEFSPNSKYLYVAGDYYDLANPSTFANYVLQYDVSLSDVASIRLSKYILAWKPRIGGAYTNMGTLQIAPDGKIYLAEIGAKQLSVIDYPNRLGAACNFNYRSLELQRTCTYGLPSFIQSNFRGNWSYRGKCTGELIFFDYDKATNDVSVKWDFGDPDAGINNTSFQDSSQHVFNKGGVYIVKLIRFTACGSDTLTKTLHIGPDVNLGGDSLICDANQFAIIPQLIGSNNNFLWQDSSTSITFTANKSGLYWLELNDIASGCKKRDSILVTFQDKPDFNAKDRSICAGMMLTLMPEIKKGNDLKLLWNTGSTDTSIIVSHGGNYSLTVSNQCAAVTKDFKVDPGLCQLFTPSAFTPNGDGLNDEFKMLSGENIEDFNMQVYNRYGTVIYSTRDQSKGWDGRYKGCEQIEGVYVWIARYKIVSDPGEKILKGTVMLIR